MVSHFPITCSVISLESPWSYHYRNLGFVTFSGVKVTFSSCSISSFKDNVKKNNMAWWLKSAGALKFALSQEQCPISLGISEIIIIYI